MVEYPEHVSVGPRGHVAAEASKHTFGELVGGIIRYDALEDRLSMSDNKAGSTLRRDEERQQRIRRQI